jgi:hypothetical protein
MEPGVTTAITTDATVTDAQTGVQTDAQIDAQTVGTARTVAEAPWPATMVCVNAHGLGILTGSAKTVRIKLPGAGRKFYGGWPSGAVPGFHPREKGNLTAAPG